MQLRAKALSKVIVGLVIIWLVSVLTGWSPKIWGWLTDGRVEEWERRGTVLLSLSLDLLMWPYGKFPGGGSAMFGAGGGLIVAWQRDVLVDGALVWAVVAPALLVVAPALPYAAWAWLPTAHAVFSAPLDRPKLAFTWPAMALALLLVAGALMTWWVMLATSSCLLGLFVDFIWTTLGV
ncbi:hypothetical protein E3N88_09881 [Mikania micrantha]|uniref:Uncharacterized protein n=1 Tax=Mikania micrantha TaxID=192012 RepID=A0A5N6PNE4_9ASTR|nr:hypothetical protein E3N88_09881 [Mikania micrantha]